MLRQNRAYPGAPYREAYQEDTRREAYQEDTRREAYQEDTRRAAYQQDPYPRDRLSVYTARRERSRRPLPALVQVGAVAACLGLLALVIIAFRAKAPANTIGRTCSGTSGCTPPELCLGPGGEPVGAGSDFSGKCTLAPPCGEIASPPFLAEARKAADSAWFYVMNPAAPEQSLGLRPCCFAHGPYDDSPYPYWASMVPAGNAPYSVLSVTPAAGMAGSGGAFYLWARHPSSATRLYLTRAAGSSRVYFAPAGWAAGSSAPSTTPTLAAEWVMLRGGALSAPGAGGLLAVKPCRDAGATACSGTAGGCALKDGGCTATEGYLPYIEPQTSTCTGAALRWYFHPYKKGACAQPQQGCRFAIDCDPPLTCTGGCCAPGPEWAPAMFCEKGKPCALGCGSDEVCDPGSACCKAANTSCPAGETPCSDESACSSGYECTNGCCRAVGTRTCPVGTSKCTSGVNCGAWEPYCVDDCCQRTPPIWSCKKCVEGSNTCEVAGIGRPYCIDGCCSATRCKNNGVTCSAGGAPCPDPDTHDCQDGCCVPHVKKNCHWYDFWNC